MDIEVGTCVINFQPEWIGNRVKDMDNTSWYRSMHQKGDEYIIDNLFDEYIAFGKNCRKVRLYSYRLSALSGWL